MKIPSALRSVLLLFVVPALFYLVCFIALSWPSTREFSTVYITDGGDGAQMIWNLWWVNKAVTELHQLPWYTHMQYYPAGISLLGHTLTPFNGFMAIVLFRFLSSMQTFNAVLYFSFVMSGVTMFWLAREATRTYGPSLVAGFIFTFCNYHFAHAYGHLNLASVEWFPLFLLMWFRFLRQPRMIEAVAAALALLLVILCDYYYFYFCVMTGGVMWIWTMICRKDFWLPFRRGYRGPLAVFALITLATSGILVMALINLTSTDPLSGHHDPRDYPLDLLAPFIPGGHWHFSEWTAPIWSRFKGIRHESSVHIGLSVTALLIIACAWRRRLRDLDLSVWWVLLAVFTVLALGPRLNVCGREIPFLWMPCAALGHLPFLKDASVPVRFILIATLAAAVLAAGALRELGRQGTGARWAMVGLLALMAFEYWPSRMPRVRIKKMEYVQVLRDQPGSRALFDAITSPNFAVGYQTVHQKPISFGYVSREPHSVGEQNDRQRALYASGDYRRLRDEYGFGYIVVPPETDVTSNCPNAKLLCRDEDLWLYSLGDGP